MYSVLLLCVCLKLLGIIIITFNKVIVGVEHVWFMAYSYKLYNLYCQVLRVSAMTALYARIKNSTLFSVLFEPWFLYCTQDTETIQYYNSVISACVPLCSAIVCMHTHACPPQHKTHYNYKLQKRYTLKTEMLN